MFRDFKFLGRNSGKNSNSDEIVNIPVNPRDIPDNQPIADSYRAPLSDIPEQIQNCKASDSGVPFRTPEKPGAPSKARFGWAHKSGSLGAPRIGRAAFSKGLPSICGTSTVVNTAVVPYSKLRKEKSLQNQSKELEKGLQIQELHCSLEEANNERFDLKNELESALESLKGVQKEMAKLRVEKEEVLMSGQQCHESTKSILNQVLSLQEAMTSFEKQLGFQLISLEQKLQKVEDTMQEFGICLFEEHEVVAAQKTAEASWIPSNFEEAQDTMMKADIMINELVIANATLKLEIGQARTSEKRAESDLSEMKNLILDLKGIASQAQFTSMEDFMSIHSDILSMKSQIQETTKLMHSWIEEIWSETLVKDCSLSVLHQCLLERLTGLNAEIGLLYQGLSESNSVMSELREHNFKVKEELEMCRILKGKLLADIKNGFDRISRKEDETGELSIKLTGFEKKILDLQLQEELMLQRSNHMGSELGSLMEELDMSRRNMLATLRNQETMVKMQEEVLSSQEEMFAVDICAKDFELLILASEYKQSALQRGKLEEACKISSENIDNLKSDLILLKVDAELKEWVKGAEIALLENEAEDKNTANTIFCSDLTNGN